MILVVTPPNVSTPSESGVTSRSRISLTSPPSTPACTAAPIATTSSGFTLRFGAFPNISCTKACIAGILVEPPTNTFSSMFEGFSSASFNELSKGFLQRSIKVLHNSSNLSRVNTFSMCFGPSGVTDIKGKFIVLSAKVDNSIFAFSAASVRRCNA